MQTFKDRNTVALADVALYHELDAHAAKLSLLRKGMHALRHPRHLEKEWQSAHDHTTRRARRPSRSRWL